MNLNIQEASLYLHKLMEVLKPRRDVEVVVSPTTLTLQSLSMQINRRIAKLAAQNCYWRDHGAYTGEVPAAHLRGIKIPSANGTAPNQTRKTPRGAAQRTVEFMTIAGSSDQPPQRCRLRFRRNSRKPYTMNRCISMKVLDSRTGNQRRVLGTQRTSSNRQKSCEFP